jgi:hypothetical protein
MSVSSPDRSFSLPIWKYFSFFGEAVCYFRSECSENSVFQVSQGEVSTQSVVWQ